jgi:hypothetical protein
MDEDALNALVHENSELHARKRVLLSEKAGLDKRIKEIDAELVRANRERFEIASQDPAKAGYFDVRSKAEYETVTKPRLQKLCVEFHQHLAQTDEAKLAARDFAVGQAEWMWTHRVKVVATRVTCVRTQEEEEHKAASAEKRKRERAMAVGDAVPRNAEEFVSHEHLKDMEDDQGE